MKDFDDLDGDEEKVQFLKDLLGPIAEKHGGKVKHIAKEDEVHCTGQFEKRPFRLIMDTSTGGLKAEVKLANTVGIIDIIYDPEAEPPADEADPEWDEGEEQRYFM